MKFLKYLTGIFAVTLLLNCIGVNASNYLILNNVAVPMKQQSSPAVTGKDEISQQYVQNTTTSHNRGFQAQVLGKDIFGNTCSTTYKNLPKNTWTTHGNYTTDGCGLEPVGDKAFLNVRTSSSYNDTTFFWGTWITTESLYNAMTK